MTISVRNMFHRNISWVEINENRARSIGTLCAGSIQKKGFEHLWTYDLKSAT